MLRRNYAKGDRLLLKHKNNVIIALSKLIDALYKNAIMINWSVTVSEETNEALHRFLAEHGDSDISDFIEKAVQEKIFRSTIQEVHDRNTAFPSEEIESVIDEAVSATRAAHRS
jgi:uncharacterized protein YmfQ (DUF2313 family)